MARKVFVDFTLEQARMIKELAAADRVRVTDPTDRARIEAIERVLARALRRFDTKNETTSTTNAESPPGDR